MVRLRALLRALFGELRWTPPSWLARCGAGWQRLNEVRRRAPGQFWGILFLTVAMIGGSYSAVRWYRSLPRPHRLTWQISTPEPTNLYGPEANQPHPLRIFFSDSAAPLEQIGKVLPTGPKSSPELRGRWKWDTDRLLLFEPESDWEVGRTYEIRFGPDFFASHVRPESDRFRFTSPELRTYIRNLQLYEDPKDPKQKKVVATIESSHVIDKGDFEKHLKLDLRVDPIASFDEPGVKPYPFTVSYDDIGAKAFLHSAPLAIPEKPAEMRLSIESGVHAARGGAPLAAAVVDTARIPSIETYFRIASTELRVVSNRQHEMERVLMIESTATMAGTAIHDATELWELPSERPAIGNRPAIPDYDWSSEREIVPEVLAHSRRVELTWLPTEQETGKLHSARFSAPTGSHLFLRVRHGMQSVEGYPLVNDSLSVFSVEPFPAEVKILYDGSLLSLSGDKQLSLLVRNLDAIQFELGRLLPNSVAHILAQSDSGSTFQQPQLHGFDGFDSDYYSESFGLDDLAERFSEIRPLPKTTPGTSQYTTFDFSSHLRRGESPRGLFWLRARGWDPDTQQALSEASDGRLILVTDLGLIAKDFEDHSHDIFVMSIREGRPVAGARIDVLGRNGLPVLSQTSDANGRVHFPTLDDLKREKAPVAYIAQFGDDYTFLPYKRRDRVVDFSRFDVGGIRTNEDERGLQAYLFSDRGVYRPGEEIHLGAIVRRVDWRTLPAGLPLEIVVTDPIGSQIVTRTVKAEADGLIPFDFTTSPNSHTGAYQVTLNLIGDNALRTQIGAVRVRVEDFTPDQLNLRAELSTAPRPGWISPENLHGRFELKNLFGTPAAGGTVSSTLQLNPTIPTFAPFPDFNFHDPVAASKSYDESLADVATDDSGHAEIDLQLGRFEHATYRLLLKAEAVGPEKGRAVAATASALVSPLPYLVGWKADGDLAFIHRDTKRNVEIIAIDPDLRKVSVDGLHVEVVETRYVSVLTRQEDGTLAYQSVRRDEVKRRDELTIDSSGRSWSLPTNAPGSFALIVRDSANSELNRISYDVVGDTNEAGQLERSSELRIKLDKTDYAAGDPIEISIQAPYVGAGLITLERDHVYVAQWFKADTTSSVQHITVPPELEGNGYVVVSFVRSLASPEIFTSPLSSGAIPFSVSRTRHTQPVTLSIPERVLPGQPMRIGYHLDRPSRLMVWAVDEGILQVARYRQPNPLDYFFRKRALAVETRQILDLILPDHDVARRSAATGGDDDALAFGAKNPFRRRGLAPVAYWSGILDAAAGDGDVSYTVPDYFNGTVRVFALAVTANSIGIQQTTSLARGAFVVQPTIPYAVAPGDEFQATVLIANTGDRPEIPDSVKATIEVSGGLEILDSPSQDLQIPTGRDATASFRLRARTPLGPAKITARASSGSQTSGSSLELSVRPASPLVTTITAGHIDGGSGNKEVVVDRRLYPDERVVEASASHQPIGLTRALAHYLQRYPHGCTEQIVSQGLAALLLRGQPDFSGDQHGMEQRLQRTLSTLQARQDIDGGFDLWDSGGTPADSFIQAYAAHFLLECRERGISVPDTLVERALQGLDRIVDGTSDDPVELRARSYALYLIARSGAVSNGQLNTLRERLDLKWKNDWQRDITGLFIAASQQLMHLDREAADLVDEVAESVTHSDPEHYYDSLTHTALRTYLLSKHFSKTTPPLSAQEQIALVDAVAAGEFQSLSSALLLLAFEAYGGAVGRPSIDRVEIDAVTTGPDGTNLPLIGTQLLFAPVPVDANAIRFSAQAPHTLFYQLSQSGYDIDPPATVLRKKLEVLRKFKNPAGEEIDTASPLSKVDVDVTIRSLDGASHDVAIIDLLPGGFEIDLTPGGLVDKVSLASDAATWSPQFIDVREDRVLFYGSVGESARHFVYRIKPMSLGTFQVPPIFAEGLYDRSVQARSLAGHFRIAEIASPTNNRPPAAP